MQKPQARPIALLPIAIFLLLYLGSGIYFEYVRPVEDGMGFYIMSVVVAFGIALIVAFFQNRSLNFNQKVAVCAKGIGDDNIVIMLFIFLMAGAFSGLAKTAGGAENTANLLLSIIPGNLALPGMFLIACLISMAMGTSVGTITVIVPIAAAVVKSTGMSMPLMVGAVVGGAMFGDNLSVISDTTIAATRTQGVEMRDKFRTNILIALPAALITLAVLVILALNYPSASMASYTYNIWLAIPYFIVLILALTGLNVFLVLGIGIILFFLIGGAAGTLNFSTAFSAMGDGTSGMFETIIVTILVASISALMKEYGGFEAILAFIRRFAKGKRGGMLGICLLTGFMDIATANNTVAIVIAAPIAKEISHEYGVEPKKVASLLDSSSCIFQGIIPYGAQLLIASSLAGISSMSIIPYLSYPFLLLICMLISILLDRKKKA
ncbi:Na+/H+ antiporter NhaC family protein [uncultured Ruminococcus sp.]|uniref:Na+/H+ antiporter NhaC family protein n=1 Tax=uncultured Ruminococcus sp. TaxID=165186 RepID=UPI00292D8641|nr:Na+/H+ antiporter NhaC family protein [uncultured Ruminococcus sp.]